MRLVTTEDVDLVATLAMCARLGKRRILEQLRDRYEDPQADRRAVFDYGLCRAVFLLNDPNDTDKGPHLVAALQAFSRCLELDPQWWLPRYLRAELASVLAGPDVGAAAPPPEQDLDALRRMQSGVAHAPAYFLSTHAATLRARLRAGAVEPGIEEFNAAVPAGKLTPAGFSLAFLDHPFRESVLLLRHLGHHATADSVKAVGLAIYPESQPLQVL